jgi:hypothetical protein
MPGGLEKSGGYVTEKKREFPSGRVVSALVPPNQTSRAFCRVSFRVFYTLQAL